MSRKVISCSILALSVAACSGNDARRAAGSFEYATLEEAQALTVPTELDKPKAQNEFHIVASDKVRGPIGENVDVRAPSLVLPIASSSRAVADTSDAIIWFDKVLEDKDLKFFIYHSIEELLREQDASLTAIDDNGLLFESSWLNKEKEDGWLFKDVVQTQSMKFKYELLTKPHGRSVGVKVSLVDYIRKDASDGETTEIDPIDQARAEMAMLNEITNQVDFKYRKQQRENRLLKATQELVSQGENERGEAAYIVEMSADLLWQNMPIFFERHGFTVNDLDESKQIYFVDYVKPDVSLWDSIWGDGVPVLEFENAKYKMVLTEKSESETFVTIYDDADVALTPEVLEGAYEVIAAGLSFRD